MARPTPSVFNPGALDGRSTAPDEHPRYREYVAYARMRRHSLAFWDWLKADKEYQGRQRDWLHQEINRPGCASPLRRRRVRRGPQRPIYDLY
jgi:hypothetical protein